MYALYILNIRTEIRRMIDFVLEEDSRDFILDEIRRLDRVSTIVQEVVLE